MPLCACVGLFFALVFNQPEPPPTHILSGYVSQYDEGLMPKVIVNRLAWDQITQRQVSDTDVFAATLSCDLIGRNGTIQWLDSGIVETILITDCSGHVSTSEWMTRDNIIVEVDYLTAKRHGFIDSGGIYATVALQP